MSSSSIASPADLPKRSWGSTLKRTLREFKADKLNHWAAALTYFGVLSLFGHKPDLDTMRMDELVARLDAIQRQIAALKPV